MKKEKTMTNKSQLGMIIYRFRKNKLAMFGLAAIVFMIIMCAAAPLYINYDAVIKQSMANRFIAPCKEFWFGTDQFGLEVISTHRLHRLHCWGYSWWYRWLFWRYSRYDHYAYL